ncbi:MAG: prolipoprotein diacylglyceryl transferase family protein, partial [Thiobacillaceae bacterium]
MLVYPQFDPVAVHLGPLSVHWYGLMYLVAFLQLWWLGKRRLAARPELGIKEEGLDDLLFYGVLGVVLGGRLGQV